MLLEKLVFGQVTVTEVELHLSVQIPIAADGLGVRARVQLQRLLCAVLDHGNCMLLEQLPRYGSQCYALSIYTTYCRVSAADAAYLPHKLLIARGA